MNSWLKLGWKDLFRHRRLTLLFTCNLTIGLIGLVSIGSLENSYIRYLENSLQEILTADLMVYSSRPLKSDEQQVIHDTLGSEVTTSRQVAFYSMVKGTNNAILCRIVAIDDNYPLYGGFVYSSAQSHQKVISLLQSGPRLLVTRETAAALGADQGECVQIGKARFAVAAFYDKAPGNDLTSIDLAPKIFLGLSQLEQTGLIRFGSRIGHLVYYRLAPAVDARATTTALRSRLDALADGDSPLRVFDTHDINRRIGRLADYFFGYMGLVGTVALFLAGIAAAYLFRGYFQGRVKEIAILMSLGAKRHHCMLLFLLQLAMMGSTAALLAALVTWCTLPLIPAIFGGVLPDGFSVALHPGTMLITFLLGISCSFLFCLPELIKLSSIRPLHLLKEGASWNAQHPSQSSLRWWLSLLPATALFLLLAILLTSSVLQGAVFTAGVAAAMLLFGVIGRLFLALCRRLSSRSTGLRRITLRNLYRNRFSSLSVFITIATGVFLLNLIPQIQKGLQDEISQPDGLRIPVFFLVDIQEEQRNELINYFEHRAAELSSLSPMVRGRIVSINGTPFHQHRIQADRKGRGGLRRTEFNFSSRDTLDPSETIIAGERLTTVPWSPRTGAPFEISIAQHFGKRYDLGLHDRMLFDIQGIQLEGKVVNIRKVRWNSFQPNFFLLFQTGVLDNAPKTYLASVSDVAPEAQMQLKAGIVDRFPNVSVIDVTATITTLMDLTDKLTFSIRSMALLAIGAGLTALYSIAGNEAAAHDKEINLLKVLGARFASIRLLAVMEFGILGCTASLVAVILSSGLSYLFSWYFFDRLWSVNLPATLTIATVTILTCIVTAALATRSVIRRKPVSLLR